MPRYCIETYGCQMNVADSELIAGILAGAAWEPASGPADADLIVVNTCSVRERAVDRVIGRVRSLAALKAHHPGLRIVVAGCVPQHLGAEFAALLPDVDLFIGPDAYRRLPDLLAPGGAAPAAAGAAGDPARAGRLALERDRQETYAGVPPARRGGVHAWVTVMRGCDRFCTYCAVPFGRGRERSLPAAAVVADVEQVAAEGFRAVTLLGQAVTSWRDGGRDFAWLIERLARVAGLAHLRFLAPHPADFTERLLESIASHPQPARHLHLPVQSGSDRILAAMRRGYTRADFLALVESARRIIPGVGITTDLLVGFPGETEDDYRQTLDLMNEVRFDSAFMFAYSPRARTYAARHLADDVEAQVKQARLAQVIELQERHSWERFSALVGARRPVLVEGRARGSERRCFGRCLDSKPVVIEPLPGQEPAPGDILEVEITRTTSHTLTGRPVG
jgi:tRNA-2-methylthio-N6-dimethylallyladenosine synthase